MWILDPHGSPSGEEGGGGIFGFLTAEEQRGRGRGDGMDGARGLSLGCWKGM